MRRRHALAVALTIASCSPASTTTADPGPCVADTNEGDPNDDVKTPSNLGSIRDDDEPPLGPESSNAPKLLKKAFTTTTSGDVDWYVVDVLDTGINGNPKISVIVGEGHEVTAFWSCSTGGGTTDSVLCGLGTRITDGDPDLPSGKGCRSQPASNGAPPQLTMMIECGGTSTDNGRLHLRVKRTAPETPDACLRYTLTVGAD